MMNVEAAKRIAVNEFPNGPESLAEKLGIKVLEGPLSGCDGWVLSGPAGLIIRLNSRNPSNRRRFTLAHELGHLLLGVPTVVGESVYDSLKSDDAEERRVNDLASELLLPEAVVRQSLQTVPVVATQLRKLAKQAKISELAVAIRVANLAKEIGLVNASVAFFVDDEFQWTWSKTLKLPTTSAATLLKAAKKADPEPIRIQRKATNDVIIASLIENPLLNSATLFVQLLPADVGNQLSVTERRRLLEEFLFKDDDQFRMQVQGVFGGFRSKCEHLSLDEAFTEFFEKKGERWDGVRRTRIHSAKGREYVRLRLQEWCE